jgi:hypothetical protein
LTLGALAVGAAGTAANSIGQAKAAKKQEAEYSSWANVQEKNRANENIRQEGLRKEAQTAQQKGVADLSAENQKRVQEEEAARLTKLTNEETMQPTASPSAPTSVADPTLTGSGGGGEVFKTDLAKGIADATASAKQRIGAMATVNSFGGGTYGSLDTVNPLALGAAGRGIDEANEKRRGSLSAYGVEQAVDPNQIEYSNPIADVASSFLGAGFQGAGNYAAGGPGLGGKLGVSSIFDGKVKPKVAPLKNTMVPFDQLPNTF